MGGSKGQQTSGLVRGRPASFSANSGGTTGDANRPTRTNPNGPSDNGPSTPEGPYGHGNASQPVTHPYYSKRALVDLANLDIKGLGETAVEEQGYQRSKSISVQAEKQRLSQKQSLGSLLSEEDDDEGGGNTSSDEGGNTNGSPGLGGY